MAEPVTIARPYAEAAFRLARERHALEGWSQMLHLLEVVAQDERVVQCAGDPNVSSAQLEHLVLGVCGERLDGAGRNFVQTLVGNDRLGVVPAIRALFENLKREQEGTLDVEIASAYALGEEQQGELVRRLESKYLRKVNARVSIDPGLIGGVKIVVGDKVLDATVRGKLEAMAVALTH